MKFTLPSGETEVILTTLCDTVAFPKKEFYTIYGKRWGQETYFESGPSRGHRIKNIGGRSRGHFELERFNGQTVESVRQHFFGIIFACGPHGP